MRQSLSRGGHLELCYGTLESGKFDIYRNEEVFFLSSILFCVILIFCLFASL